MTKRDEAVIEAAKQKRLKKLQNKQKEVDKIDEEKPMYYLAIVLKLFIQLGCALLASCGVTALVSDFVDNPYVVAGISIAMLGGIEFVIHLSGTRVSLAKIKGNKQNFRIVVSLLFFVLFSFISTFLGSHSTVSYFIKSPNLVSIDGINAKYDSLETANQKYWTEKEQFFLAQADSVHKRAKWLGVTTRDARPLELAHKKSAKEMKDSLIKYSTSISNARVLKVSKAEKENELILAKHSDKTIFYGNCLKWISLGGYILMFLLMLFIEDHEVREVEYLSLDSDLDPTGESSSDNSTNETQGKEGKEKDDSGQSGGQSRDKEGAKGKVLNKIGYIKDEFKDGDLEFFDNPNKKPRIYLQKKNGEIKGYKESEMKGLIKQSSDDRAKELEPYLKKLQDATRRK